MPPKRNRYREFGRQADRIEQNGSPVEHPCRYCHSHHLPCIMDSKSRNCSSCTRRGRKCEKRFHSDKEWDDLSRSEEQISAQLEEAENQIELLLAKVKRLRKQRKFLKERGLRMLDHDTAVMDKLNEDDPLSAEDLAELERLANEHEGRRQSGNSLMQGDPQPLEGFSPGFIAEFLASGGPEEGASGSPRGS